MPKTPARDDYFAQSFRFTPEQAATIKEEAQRLGSTTAFVRELIDDYRTLFGLPRIQVEVLEADMKILKFSTHREYVRHLLALRYQNATRGQISGRQNEQALTVQLKQELGRTVFWCSRWPSAIQRLALLSKLAVPDGPHWCRNRRRSTD